MLVQRLVITAILGPELRRWTQAGHSPRFWWRDDDARVPSPALIRLLDLSKQYGAPLTLATVPDGDLQAMATLVRDYATVEIAIHGFRHENRADPGQPSGEIIDVDRPDQVVNRIEGVQALLTQVGLVAQVFVPPWNNLHPTLSQALAVTGLDLSCHGQMRQTLSPPHQLDTHLDLMRWKPMARFRGTLRVADKVRRLLAQRRRDCAWNEPIGLLSHHIDHDVATWQCLEYFLSTFQIISRRDGLS